MLKGVLREPNRSLDTARGFDSNSLFRFPSWKVDASEVRFNLDFDVSFPEMKG